MYTRQRKMSLLEQINEKKKTLNVTDTLITCVDGSTYVETSKSRLCGEQPRQIDLDVFKHGFVVDTKPDNVPVELIKGLFLGSQDCAEDSVLFEYNITHVLSIGVDSNTSAKHKMFIDCLDLPDTDVNTLLELTNPFIESVLNSDGVLLVHCNAGVSRSVTVVIGYLMIVKKMQFGEAYQLVKSKRPCARPNDGFMKQLKSMCVSQTLLQ